MYPGMKDMMKAVESRGADDYENIRQMYRDNGNDEEIMKVDGELYEILCLGTEGEAKNIVRSQTRESGLGAYGLLHDRFNRRTISRVMRVHREVMYPKKTGNVNQLMEKIVEWEQKWNKMQREEEHKNADVQIPVVWKIAAFLELCPREITEQVMLNMDDIGENYEKLRNKVTSWATN